MTQEIRSFEEAARAVEPIFRKHGWRYARSAGAHADWEEIEETMRSLAFHSALSEGDDDGDEFKSDSISSGRILVTRDHLGSGGNTRSVYLHLFDL